jgi:hypothetical protein
MRLVCILAVLVASATPALAGECDEATGEQTLSAIEKYARDSKAKPADVWGLCMDQVITAEPRRTARFLAACEKILATDRTYGVCVKWPIEIGKKQLGQGKDTIDLFDLVEEAFKMEPLVWDSEPALLYIKLDDPRAMPRLIAGWKAQLAAKKPPRASWQLQAWARFRAGVARFLGKHGGAPEKAFLEEQRAATGDPDLGKSIRAAIAAIDKRAAAPARP